ncbi:hypothetical protein FQN57_001924 [Myotisia sp. PD_48]|nr:hypothetical protein FQN57_001924 [Myotisia sp. PD_48]
MVSKAQPSSPVNREIDQLSEKEREFLTSYAASISTTATVSEDEQPPAYTDSSDRAVPHTHHDQFQPGKSFIIKSRGIGLIRLPFPSSELEIEIQHPDGSLAYISKREKRCSGDAVLSCPNRGPLLSTTYFFGPGRDPVVKLLPLNHDEKENSPAEEVHELVIGGKLISRTSTFEMPDGSKFEWRYVRLGYDGGGRTKALVLEKIIADPTGGAEQRKRVAQLLRTADTLAEGSSKRNAGAGGELRLDSGADLELDEAVIVGTCVLALKREIDRRRAIQFIVLGGMAGS